MDNPDMGISGTSMEVKGDSYMYDHDYHRFTDYLGIDEHDRKDSRVADKAAYIYDWAKEQVGRDDRDTILRALNEYQRGIGETAKGKTLLDRLYRDIRLGVSGDSKKKPEQQEFKKSVKALLKLKENMDQSINKTLAKILKNG